MVFGALPTVAILYLLYRFSVGCAGHSGKLALSLFSVGVLSGLSVSGYGSSIFLIFMLVIRGMIRRNEPIIVR